MRLGRIISPAGRCQNVGVGMRTDCKHYESRTYANGEVVRKCRIDLAPEAPWRCPEDCPGYRRKMIDVGWQYGSMKEGLEEAEPEPAGEDVGALLDEAELIVNSAAPEILAEFEAPKKKKKKKRRFGRRKRK